MSQLCNPTELRPICPSGYPINDCGRPVPPSGEFVDLEANLVFTTVLAAAPSPAAIRAHERKRVFEDADFILLSMSVQLDPAHPANDFYYKVQYPDGRYSSNVRQSILLTTGIGNRRRNFYPGEIYQAGSFIPFELENRTAAAITVAIIFEGLKRMYLR